MLPLFKNWGIEDTIGKIVEDENFTIQRFWLKKSYVRNILTTTPKLQLKTARKVLEMYNAYVENSRWIEDLFYTEKLINYEEKSIEFIFKTDAPKEIVFSFIEKILSIDTPHSIAWTL